MHGEAVAAGMVIASQISVLRGTLDASIVEKLITFNRAVGLPVEAPPSLSASDLLQAMSSDKKVSSGKIRYILLRGLGEAVVTEHVTTDDIVSALSA